MADGVLDQRLHAEERHCDGEHLRCDPQPHLQTVPEPGLLQQQVALHRPELLGERRVLAVAAERVAGEVRELQQQLAGPVGVGAHEAGDRAERVVDEVRADLRAERPDLRLHRAGAARVELGQVELPRHPARHLLGRPGQAGGVARREHLERPHDPLVGDQRCHHGGAHRATPLTARQVAAVHHPGGAALDGLLGQPVHLRPVVVPGTVPGEQRVRVGQGQGRTPQQCAQVPDRLAGAVGGQARAQGGAGERGRVQRPERRAVGVRAEVSASPGARAEHGASRSGWRAQGACMARRRSEVVLARPTSDGNAAGCVPCVREAHGSLRARSSPWGHGASGRVPEVVSHVRP